MPKGPRPEPDPAAGPRGGLREAILGLLAIRPMSGYDISRSYARALQRVWYAPVGQVYPTLRAMLREGLLDVEIHVQETRPNRKEYTLTDDGRAALLDWLTERAALPFMHHEFVGKLFLLDNIPPDEQLEFVEDYAQRCAAWAKELEAIDRKITPALDGPLAKSARFQILALRHLRRLADAEVRSARITLKELGGDELPDGKRDLDSETPGDLVDLWLGAMQEPRS